MPYGQNFKNEFYSLHLTAIFIAFFSGALLCTSLALAGPFREGCNTVEYIDQIIDETSDEDHKGLLLLGEDHRLYKVIKTKKINLNKRSIDSHPKYHFYTIELKLNMTTGGYVDVPVSSGQNQSLKFWIDSSHLCAVERPCFYPNPTSSPDKKICKGDKVRDNSYTEAQQENQYVSIERGTVRWIFSNGIMVFSPIAEDFDQHEMGDEDDFVSSETIEISRKYKKTNY